MATPLAGWSEWDPATTDGPAEVAALARQIEQGVVLRFPSAATRDSTFTSAGIDPATVAAVCRLDTDPAALYVHDGSAWRRHSPDVLEIATGRTTVTFDNTHRADPVSVSFPSGRFTGTPVVTSNVESMAGISPGMVARISGVTTTGFTLNGEKTDGTAVTGSVTYGWIAARYP